MRRMVVLIAFTFCFSLILPLPVLVNAQRTADAEIQLKRGISLAEKGKLDEAIEQFLKIIENNPNYELAYSNLGTAYYQKGQLDKAIEALKKAIELNPNNKVAHSNLGNVYIDAGKYDEAIAEHRKVIELDPNNAEAFINLAVAFSQKGDLEEGIGQLKKAISLNLYHPLARKNLGYSYCRMKKWPEAIDELLLARDIDEWYPGVEETLTETLKQAFSDLEKWLNEKPMEPVAHYYLSYALAYKGDWKKAMKEIEKAIELDKSKAEFYKAKALFQSSQNKYKEAIVTCQECTAIDSGNWACYNFLGQKYLAIGKPKEALQVLTKAGSINPDIINIHANLGVAYSLNGENEQAALAFQKALSLGAANPILYFNLAATYFNIKNYDMAWKYTRMAERKGHPRANELIKLLRKVSKEPD